MITLNLTFRLIEESAAKINAAIAIRHGAVTL